MAIISTGPTTYIDTVTGRPATKAQYDAQSSSANKTAAPAQSAGSIISTGPTTYIDKSTGKAATKAQYDAQSIKPPTQAVAPIQKPIVAAPPVTTKAATPAPIGVVKSPIAATTVTTPSKSVYTPAQAVSGQTSSQPSSSVKVIQTGQNSYIKVDPSGKQVGTATAADFQAAQPKSAPISADQQKADSIIAGLGFGYDSKTATEMLKKAGLDPSKYTDQLNKQMASYAAYRDQSAQHGTAAETAQAAADAAAKAAAEERARKDAQAKLDATTGTAKLQAQRAASPSNTNVPSDLKLTPQEAKATATPTSSNAVTQSPISNSNLEDIKKNTVNSQAAETVSKLPAVTASPAVPATPKATAIQTQAETPVTESAAPAATPAGTTNQDWMKELFGDWQKAYGKESGYRDTLMGGVAKQSFDPAKAMDFAQSQAKAEAVRDSDAAARQSIKAARSAGINPAQAAILAGQQTGNVYNQALGQAQQQALSQYNQSQQAQQQAASLTGGMQNQLLPSAVGLQQGAQNADLQRQQLALAQQQYANAKTDQDRSFWGSLLAGLAPLAASTIPLLFSDSRVKDNVKTVSYTYKGSSRPEIGVLAQDLEKTPLKTSVVEGPGGVKMVDTRRLTTQNTAMIADLARKVDRLAKAWGEK